MILGDCRNESLVIEIFGSVTEFARQVELNGDWFVYGNIDIIYHPKKDIHTFHRRNAKIIVDSK